CGPARVISRSISSGPGLGAAEPRISSAAGREGHRCRCHIRSRRHIRGSAQRRPARADAVCNQPKPSVRSAVEEYLDSEVAEHAAVIASTRQALAEEFVRLVSACSRALRAGNKLLFFGNGGSAADAQHLATDLVVRYKQFRPALAAIALTTDTSAL